VQLVDLVPTVLELVGIEVDAAGFEGQSLVPSLVDTAEPDPLRPVLLQRRTYAGGAARNVKRRVAGEKLGVRIGNWKYLEAPGENSYELYDLDSDPGELVNLHAGNPGKSAQLSATLAAWRQSNKMVVAPQVSEEDARRLEALGYVQ
jgi:arylsulfatase A-like enzyme